jgi:tetratricopeptide (TPR) repeat protein
MAHRNRGLVYQTKGDLDRAIADYNEAIALDPKDPVPYYVRGLARRARGDTAGGNADITKARQIDPNIGR